ncbi:Transglutaminase-like enzyme, putative cysteine protease [Methylomagnum ishizawai]|uniref:Transglutaminase-like enzyme, putative cysteine protease n=1 Tax=Methylomagnum ishizawai TaxID=1760988 RepID=A0A1Y6DA18_9GAMM|nr:transglutaminase family protein [Methylomagnum ishizawai]SMF97202.1 Transglutaminase-like enzyme, putative cysteine protease [Methylomagnum ishizawai]
MRYLLIEHDTVYDYGNPVILLQHRLLLRPREGRDIHVETAELRIAPAHRLRWQRDAYDNALAVVDFLEPARRLAIGSRVGLRHYQDRPLDFVVAEYAVYFPFQYPARERIDLGPYLPPVFGQDSAAVGAWLEQFWRVGQVVETYLLLDRINKAIAIGFVYQPREEPGVQSPATTLARRAGSCRDFATLFIDACHWLGLAARFVSGYLYEPTPIPAAGATHAWAEVYLPGAGWRGFDATSGQVVGDRHIAVAVHRHPEAVSPVTGAFTAVSPESPVMQVAVKVAEIAG